MAPRQDFLTRAQAIAGLATAGGVGALTYAIGYIAINQRAETLGLPDTTATPGAYIRAGYFFVIDSAAALLLSVVSNWLWIAVVCSIGAMGAFGIRKINKRQHESARAQLMTFLIAAGYIVSTAVAIKAALRIRQAFEANNLFFLEGSALESMSDPAKCIVMGLADRSTEVLKRVYGDVVGFVTIAILVMVVSWGLSLRHKGVTLEALSPLKWLPISAIIATLSLMPFFYGMCYLTSAPPCVELTPTPQFVKELKGLGIQEEDMVIRGFLASNLDEQPTQVQVLVVEGHPQLYAIDRAKLTSIRFLRDCGSLLPGFAKKSTCSYQPK